MPPFDPPLTEAEIAPLFPSVPIVQTRVAGGQGAVFRVNHPDYGDSALKITSPVYYERVEREIEALKTIDHPNIYKLLDYGHVNLRGQVCPFTFTEYVDGEDLQEQLDRVGSIEEDGVLEIVSAMSEALNILWAKRIVHRDIKPANILLNQQGTAILIDLGIARHIDREAITSTGHWLGTLGYMSPEQARAQRALTVKSDIFALGITCYEALCGQHPFYSNQALIMRQTPPPRPLDLASCTGEISGMLMSMMQWNPLLRPTPDAIIGAIRNWR